MAEIIALQYEELLKKNNINENDLPNEALISVKNVKNQKKGIKLMESRGKNITEGQLNKLKFADKAACREISEYVEGSVKEQEEKNQKALVEKQEKETKEKTEREEREKAEKEELEKLKQDPKGIEIEKELAGLFKEGKTTLTAQELKQFAPVSYEVVFKLYQKGSPNGVKTSHYSALETEPEKFTISKN